MLYRFRVAETQEHIMRYYVEAGSLEEAEQKALNGDTEDEDDKECEVTEREIICQEE